MKSAYELALERLEKQGIERPREDALSAATREKMAAARQKAEAKLAELEILYRDRLRKAPEAAHSVEDEDHYQRDRRRIESQRDAELARLRREE